MSYVKTFTPRLASVLGHISEGWMSIYDLSEKTGAHPSYIKRCLPLLDELGLVTRDTAAVADTVSVRLTANGERAIRSLWGALRYPADGSPPRNPRKKKQLKNAVKRPCGRCGGQPAKVDGGWCKACAGQGYIVVNEGKVKDGTRRG